MRQPQILDSIRVASPCSASWEGMTGDDRRRACRACGKDVYNLSTLTVAEALALVGESTGPRPCVRFYRRADGTVLTADCPTGAKAVRTRRTVQALAWGLGAALLTTAGLAFALRAQPDPADLTPPFPGSATPEPPRLTTTLANWVGQAMTAVGLRSSGFTVGEAEAIPAPAPGPPTADPAGPIPPVRDDEGAWIVPRQPGPAAGDGPILPTGGTGPADRAALDATVTMGECLSLPLDPESIARPEALAPGPDRP